MRTFGIVLLAAALLVGGSAVGGAALISCVIALLVAAAVGVARRAKRTGQSLVPWLVSLALAAVVVVPQLALRNNHYKHLGAFVVDCILSWLLLAALLRFAIFLTDYFRRRTTGRRGGQPETH
jgi:cell shape-determining protein MreD